MMDHCTHACKVLQKYMENIENVLESKLVELPEKLLESKIISEIVKKKFLSLDQEYLNQERRTRYLLQQVCERVREDSRVYDRFVQVLCRLGPDAKNVCEVMRMELDRLERYQSDITRSERDRKITLTKKDIPSLLKIIVSSSHKWEEIGIALHLPDYVIEECRNSGSNVLRLNQILKAWITGNYDEIVLATLETLKKALSSEIVALPDIALKVSEFQKEACHSPVNKDSIPPTTPEICLQSYSTNVHEGKSTLLEVQVSSSECNYNWNKDGQLLCEGDCFSGVSSCFLYINEAGPGTEGKYSCCVSKGGDTVCSDEINLKVIYPPQKEYLIKLYSVVQTEVPKDSWPPRGTSTFINLVLIRQSFTSKIHYYTVRGDMDDIVESKEIVEYEEVFREYREGALVLVEGRPGSGKTTLVNKLARDWATGVEVLLGVNMVYLVTLRFVNCSGKDKTLLELLEEFYNGELLRKKVEADLQECGGKGTCFIIDGLDEYQNTNMQQSVINKLINKKCLPFSMVIVASRPVATGELKRCCSRRIEVLGFTKSQTMEYVENYPFKESGEGFSDIASRLKTYLDQHPNILHMCYLPVHAAMICFLFSELEDNLKHRETQIYEQFIITTLLRQKTRTQKQQQLKCLKDLSGKDQEDFKIVCKLAYTMTIQSQQVVSQSESSVSLSDLSMSVAHLFTVEQVSVVSGVEKLYTFLHLTLQEYLAAYYVSELDKQEQEMIIEDCAKNVALKNVVKFYFGLLGIENKKFQNFDKFFQSLCTQKGRAFWYNGISLSFMPNCLPLDFVQFAFELQQVEVCEYILQNFQLRITESFMSPSDFMALGFVISAASKCVSELHLSRCTWNYDGALALSLMDHTNKLHSIKCLSVVLDHTVSSDIYKSVNGLLTQLPSLQMLDLWLLKLNSHNIEQLTNGVTLSELTVLKICLSMTPCSNVEKVLKSLRFGSPRLKQVYFKIGEMFYKSGSTFDSSNYAMWKKWLWCAFGFEVFVDIDISWLHLYSSESLSLYQHDFSYCIELAVVNCGVDDEGARILGDALNTAILESLVLDFNRISDCGAVVLARTIKKCSVVQNVSIQCNFIGDLGAKAFAGALADCSSLRLLDLQGNTLGDEGAMAIAEACDGLIHLVVNLHNVNITDDVVKILDQLASIQIIAMEFNSSWDCICEAGIDALRRALKCGMLKTLKVSRDNIFNIAKLVTELDLKDYQLECYRIDEDILPALKIIMNSMSNLQQFKCSWTASSLTQILIRSPKYDDILEVIKFHGTSLQSLSLYGGSISSQCIISLFSDHKPWVNLHTLKLNDCDIDSDSFQALGRVLFYCKRIRYFNLLDNNIDDIMWSYLFEGLQNHTSCWN